MVCNCRLWLLNSWRLVLHAESNPQVHSSPQAAKAQLQKRFDSGVTGDFRRFFGSPLFDRLARTAIQHFLARFEHDLLTKVCVCCYAIPNQHSVNLNFLMVAIFSGGSLWPLSVGPLQTEIWRLLGLQCPRLWAMQT